MHCAPAVMISRAFVMTFSPRPYGFRRAPTAAQPLPIPAVRKRTGGVTRKLPPTPCRPDRGRQVDEEHAYPGQGCPRHGSRTPSPWACCRRNGGGTEPHPAATRMPRRTHKGAPSSGTALPRMVSSRRRRARASHRHRSPARPGPTKSPGPASCPRPRGPAREEYETSEERWDESQGDRREPVLR